MALISTQWWEGLEQRRSSLFLVAGVLFGINVAIVATGIGTGAERMITLLGETVNAGAWAVALLGLLALYPDLHERSPWLARAGAVCAAIGVVVFTALSVLSLVYYLELVEGTIDSLVPLILPGVLIGGVLSFLLFGVGSLRTDVHPPSFGILLLLPSLIVITNIATGAAGIESPYALLGIVSGLLVVTLAIGFRLRSSAGRTDRGQGAPGKAVK